MLDLANKWEGWSGGGVAGRAVLAIRQKIERCALSPEPGLLARGCRHETFIGTLMKPYQQGRHRDSCNFRVVCFSDTHRLLFCRSLNALGSVNRNKRFSLESHDSSSILVFCPGNS